MNFPSSQKNDASTWSDTHFRLRQQRSSAKPLGYLSRVVAEWNRLTAPPEPPVTAPFKQRDIARRARITNVILLLSVIYFSIMSAIYLLVGDYVIFATLFFLLLLMIALFYFNRRGRLMLVGSIYTVIIVALSFSLFFTFKGGMSFADLPGLSSYILLEISIIAFFPISLCKSTRSPSRRGSLTRVSS